MKKLDGHGAIKAIQSGSYIYKRSPDIPQGGVRVRTFTRPKTVAAFVGGSVGREGASIEFEDGAVVPIVNGAGKVQKNYLPLLTPALSDDEAAVLRLFGVDLPKLAARVK